MRLNGNTIALAMSDNKINMKTSIFTSHKLQLISVFTICLCILGFSLISSQIHEKNSKDDIAEVIFKYQIDYYASERGIKLFFLSVGEKNVDPSDRFLKRLTYNDITVLKYSHSTYRDKKIVDIDTGESGAHISVGSVKLLDRNNAEAIVYSFSGFGTNREEVVQLNYKSGTWIILTSRSILDT